MGAIGGQHGFAPCAYVWATCEATVDVPDVRFVRPVGALVAPHADRKLHILRRFTSLHPSWERCPHHLDPPSIQRYKPVMTVLSDPIVIGLMIFNIVMLLGYFSSKWLKACEPEGKKEKH